MGMSFLGVVTCGGRELWDKNYKSIWGTRAGIVWRNSRAPGNTSGVAFWMISEIFWVYLSFCMVACVDRGYRGVVIVCLAREFCLCSWSSQVPHFCMVWSTGPVPIIDPWGLLGGYDIPHSTSPVKNHACALVMNYSFHWCRTLLVSSHTPLPLPLHLMFPPYGS